MINGPALQDGIYALTRYLSGSNPPRATQSSYLPYWLKRLINESFWVFFFTGLGSGLDIDSNILYIYTAFLEFDTKRRTVLDDNIHKSTRAN